MNNTFEQFTATANDNLLVLQELTTKMQANIEKLARLNMTASQTALSESFAHAKAVLEVKDVQELVNLQTGFVTPMAEKSAAYAQDFQNIIVVTNADFAAAGKANLADVQKGFTTLMENATKNAPQGTESAVGFFNQAMNAGQTAFETAQTDAQKNVDTAQSEFNAASKQTVDAFKKAGKNG